MWTEAERDAARQQLATLHQEVEALESQQLFRARTQFAAFIEYVLRDEHTLETIRLDPMHRQWLWLLEYCWAEGLVPWVMAPFGSGKSSVFVIALVLFLLGVDPTLRIMVVSANDDQAKDRLALIRRYIEASDEYHAVFPHVVPDTEASWSTKKLYIQRRTQARDASVTAMGITSSPIGARIDIMLFDDICDARNMIINPKLRETVFKNYTGPFLSRVEKPHGRVAGIATRWHVDDVFGRITRDPAMANQYGFLIQAVNPEGTALHCEVLLGHGVEGARPLASLKAPQQGLDALIALWKAGHLRDMDAEGDAPWDADLED